MTDIIGAETDVSAFNVEDVDINQLYSFPKGQETKTSYGEFLAMFDAAESKSNHEVNLKADGLEPMLSQYIKMPSFYSDLADLMNVQMIQSGDLFKDKPFYIKKEQIICVVDGLLHVAMVPHVNRQEVYAGGNWIKNS